MKTIIVGAGLNAHLYGPQHFLSSWGNFMSRFNMVSLADNIPASFAMENNIRHISNHSHDEKRASQIEDSILKEIKDVIEHDKLSKKSEKDLSWILKNHSVTDFICLNFNPPFDLKWSELEMVENDNNDKLHDREFRNNCNYYVLRNRPDGVENIRFWFPHGVSKCIDTIVFGAHRYCNQTAVIPELFEKVKIEERKEGKGNGDEGLFIEKRLKKPHSWLEPFLYNELYFLGCSLSHAEWDLWSALAFRRRNFAKKENSKFEQAIYHMRYQSEKNASYPYFIQPLFDPTIGYEDQWKMLKCRFEKEIKKQGKNEK